MKILKVLLIERNIRDYICLIYNRIKISQTCCYVTLYQFRCKNSNISNAVSIKFKLASYI